MDVTRIGLQAAAELVGVLDDRFVHVYPLSEGQVDALRELTGETFHPGSYEYFIEAGEGWSRPIVRAAGDALPICALEEPTRDNDSHV